jgi:hypothetical protein
MSITLATGSTLIELHDDLVWTDEFNWQPVEQSDERTITGALVVQAAERVGGRPITLEPADDSSAWMTRTVIEQLRAWAASPGLELQLTLGGVTRDVIFRHQDGAGLEARPVIQYSDAIATDYYLATVRLMEI